MAPRHREPQGDSPAIRLLDALQAGDELGVLAVCGDLTTVSAENMSWSCRGRDEIHRMLAEAHQRFPGLTFESRTRHIGFGLVIDEARVQDELFESDAEPDATDGTDGAADDEVSVPDPSVHPMWDEPVTEKRNVMSLWRDRSDEMQPPTRLNMPVRVTVRHDDLQVHDVTLSFPAALLKRALGMRVDPFEMSLSEVQSAFIAPVGAGFTTYELARPELSLVPPAPPEVEPEVVEDEPPRRRRGRVLIPLLIALIAVVAGGAWYAVAGPGATDTAGTPVVSHTPSPTPTPSPSPSPSAQATSSAKPKVTHEQPSKTPSHKPNVTLRSDLAFGFNSAELSQKAKAAIADVAQQVRKNRLTGKIYVDGYTDNLGSATYGLDLSQKRANAVSNYLRSQLVGVSGISIVSIGHGEADPVKSNSTAAGRQANRRVTITLPNS
ncbi:MAG TPA: OmpA family protein [Nocardioides sp.]|uniref:OmpA family protein n=1 Tax=Nocardioides sp. TaxID=35761 RepID=UPI002F4062E8